MKQFIIKSVCFSFFFAIFFVLINVIYYFIITSSDWDCRKRYESLKFKNPDFDLLVLGASLALDGIDTELLTSNGIKSYNLALGGGSLRTNHIQLKEYLSKYPKKPNTVLLAINSRLESFSDSSIHPIVEFTMENFRFSINDAPILKFKWLGFEFLKKVVSIKHREAKLSYGQLKFKKEIPDRTSYVESYLDIQKLDTLKWMGKIAQLCNQNGVDLIVLDMPAVKETRNLSKSGPYTLMFTNGYSAKFYNFNSRDFCKIFDSNKDWIGNSHLNKFGAKKFTQELLKYISRSGQMN